MKRLAPLALGLWLSACATTRQTCRFDAEGRIMEIVTRATVVGGGNTRIRTAPARRKGDPRIPTACGYLDYWTEDTGMSDNLRAAIGEAAEGAARGAAEGLVPGP